MTPEEKKIKIIHYFMLNNIQLLPESFSEGILVDTFVFRPKAGFSTKSLSHVESDLSLHLGIEGVTLFPTKGKILIHVPRENPPRFLFFSFLDKMQEYIKKEQIDKSRIILPYGITPLELVGYSYLEDAPHVLIAGETGSGKSNYEAMLLLVWSLFYKPSQLRVDLVDFKTVDFGFFRLFPIVSDIITTYDTFYTKLSEVESDVKLRLQRIHLRYRSVQEYNQREEIKIPIRVIIIDEFGALSLVMKADKERIKEIIGIDPIDKLVYLAQIARAAGIHFILTTQRSSVDIIKGTIKVNFPLRIAFKLPTAADSKTILGIGSAEKLMQKGDMLVLNQGDLLRAHVPYVSLQDIDSLLDLKVRDSGFFG